MSIDRIRAWACGLRSVWPQSIPASTRSLEYANSPITFGIASTRRTLSPTRPSSSSVRVLMRGPPPAERRRRSSRSRYSDRGSPRGPRGSRRRTAPGSARADRPSRRSAPACRSRTGPRPSRRTPPAPGGARRSRGSPLVLGCAPGRGGLLAVPLGGQDEARADKVPVEQPRARAAFPLLARVLGAGQAEALAQRVKEALTGPDLGLGRRTVDGQRDLQARVRSSARFVRTRSAWRR